MCPLFGALSAPHAAGGGGGTSLTKPTSRERPFSGAGDLQLLFFLRAKQVMPEMNDGQVYLTWCRRPRAECIRAESASEEKQNHVGRATRFPRHWTMHFLKRRGSGMCFRGSW